MHGGGAAHEITWRPTHPSATFHGRDIMGPIAGRLAGGASLREVSRPIQDPILLPDLAPASDQVDARIIHIDNFGNATTNLPATQLRQSAGISIKVKNRIIGKLKRTYWDVPPGKALALIGSSGLLEIAVRDGSAALDLKVRVGDPVQLR
jgi:S-adenosylmethionine hydrolase